MNNIASLRLENFQSHLDTTIEFSAGLNVLVGQSDSGKTAIIRGVRWVLFNQPRGTDFMRVGADFARVTLTFTHGVTIVRERTSSKNRYIIKEPNKEDLVLEGFGIHVPQEVLDAHGMEPLRVDRDHDLIIHLSQQLDGPFLLEQTSSLRAKTIGRISGAHFLDMAIRDTSKDLSGLNQRVKMEETELEHLTGELEPYQTLDKQRTKLDQAGEKLDKLKQAERKLDNLYELKSALQKLSKEKEETVTQFQLVEQVHLWEEAWNHIKQTHAYAKSLDHKRAEIELVGQSINKCREWIDKTKHISDAQGAWELIQDKVSQKQELIKLKQRYSQMIEQKNQINRQLAQTDFIQEKDWSILAVIEKKRAKVEQLRQLHVLYKQVEKAVETTNDMYKKVQHTKEAESHREKLEHKLMNYQRLKQLKELMHEVNTRIIEGNRFMNQKTEEMQRLEREFEEQLMHIGTCPTCGSSLEQGLKNQ
ncbi:AAA family ATPase [Alkalihalophilus marmarensis]|jgi:exonuclease SbcC|uniref:Nuclease SbcCD subunit C n=1 Tax=Alkalihalophilus marmarensis DSM 21297 TaxID=1188261 RepID=U6SPT0_9BACI|nr:AAA family ATPase [Alkalihalophilus marmarensis]ERN53352.1 hypothetical protein A33I_12000 [Alkalihalophilus marmarensis DSM 21297]MCM3489508.1 AAA family ATPase [Alkalihalophilus marmarensis]